MVFFKLFRPKTEVLKDKIIFTQKSRISSLENEIGALKKVINSKDTEVRSVRTTFERSKERLIDQIIELNTILDETSGELNTLKTAVDDFGSTLEKASANIDSSVTSVSSSVKNIEEASIQLNSLFFPIVASIAIIVALQITILARRR